MRPLSIPCPPLQEKVVSSIGRAHGAPHDWGLTGELGEGPPPDRGPTGHESAAYLAIVGKATGAGPTLPDPVPLWGMPAAAPFASGGMPAAAAAVPPQPAAIPSAPGAIPLAPTAVSGTEALLRSLFANPAYAHLLGNMGVASPGTIFPPAALPVVSPFGVTPPIAGGAGRTIFTGGNVLFGSTPSAPPAQTAQTAGDTGSDTEPETEPQVLAEAARLQAAADAVAEAARLERERKKAEKKMRDAEKKKGESASGKSGTSKPKPKPKPVEPPGTRSRAAPCSLSFRRAPCDAHV